MKQPFLALPARDEIPSLALLTLAFSVWFSIWYMSGSYLTDDIPWRVSVELPIDSQIPFVPWSAVIYLTITPVMLFAPFIFRDLRSFLPVYGAYMLETVVGGVCFLLLPIDTRQIACCDASVSGWFFHLADAINMERNYLPSLHVAFAFTTAMAFGPRAGRLGTLALWVWALAVAWSTLATQQHFVLDVITGFLLAVVSWKLSQSWARRRGDIVDVDLLCIRNFARFTRRHRRYFSISLAVTLAGIPHWRYRRLARTGFAFLQAVDDILDGDRPSDRDPLELTDELIASLESGRFADYPLARLGAAFRADLLEAGDVTALPKAIALIKVMQRDRQRMLSQQRLTREQLAEVHRATFRGSIDLMLLAARSKLRSSDVPLLIDALGWCSTVRDLKEDLQHGLINIPAHVFSLAIAERPNVPLTALIDTDAVRKWLDEENTRAVGLLDAVDAQLASLAGQPGYKLLLRFARSMRRYTRTPATTTAPVPATQAVRDRVRVVDRQAN